MSAIAPRLELRQGQSLSMTQQLQQSIKLLQMSSMEIAEFVEQELEKNPLLSAEDEEADKSEESKLSENTEASTQENESPAPEVEVESISVYEDETNVNETSFEGEQYEPRIKTRDNNWEEGEGFESYTASEVSLRDHLLEQLHLEVADPVKRIIGQHLIDLVDESGYIKDDTSGIATLLDCPPDLIEDTFVTLQGFDPIGICARNLAECLAIQLRDKNRLDPAMESLIGHLDLVAINNIKQLSKICGVDEDDIKEMCAEIRALNPRPGSGFQHEAVQAIIPDVFLKRNGTNWQIEVNPSSLPRVLVNRRYYAQISGKTTDRQEKKYLSEQFAAANWLIRALDSRAQTILKVATEIVKRQENFFLYGIKYLRPLTLKEVADAVELHESTVSRVTTSKFMLTARGTYEFKYFFNALIQGSDGGEGYSNKAVQFMIKEMINNEKPDKILSDDTISERLKDNGIELARRTVAKYRELMKIPSSSVRKKLSRS